MGVLSVPAYSVRVSCAWFVYIMYVITYMEAGRRCEERRQPANE